MFDVAYLNLAGSIHPSALVQALEREGQGRLCFYGPPGTGKTEFAEVIAEALDRELVARQASDLISAYVGETEQNLAKLFASLDPERSVLLLDEVDSFLADRRQAQRQWERTQVNKLLQQMERYPGIFIAATNLMSGLDAAALRRFDFKLQSSSTEHLCMRSLPANATNSGHGELVARAGFLRFAGTECLLRGPVHHHRRHLRHHAGFETTDSYRHCLNDPADHD